MDRMTEKSKIGGCFPYVQTGIINGKKIEPFNRDCLMEGFKNYDQFYGYETAVTRLGQFEDLVEKIEALENPYNAFTHNPAFAGFETAKSQIMLMLEQIIDKGA